MWADKKHFYLYVIVAAAGSALGGLVSFLLGRAGGELFLMKRIDRARYEQLRDRFEKQEFLAMMIPSILPPPTPWKLFVFAAGVFEMKISTFLLSVFAGRVIRNMITAILTIEYGPEIVNIAARLATRHRVALMAGLIVLLAAAGLLDLADGVETAGQEGRAWGGYGVGKCSQVSVGLCWGGLRVFDRTKYQCHARCGLGPRLQIADIGILIRLD